MQELGNSRTFRVARRAVAALLEVRFMPSRFVSVHLGT
jgi:hypothetical protein